ncbi:phage protease [Sodalis sp. (in: enterobacteria)]|uniref:phage protease n=1 Tax=Sodalis sp. (in: enterobacteria) TaxID=1898979 RepID=UPI003F689704
MPDARGNGQPAPAAGWYSQLEWVEGLGLFAVDVEWTERARTLIAAGEYRFVSPLFQYDRQGNVPLPGECRADQRAGA